MKSFWMSIRTRAVDLWSLWENFLFFFSWCGFLVRLGVDLLVLLLPRRRGRGRGGGRYTS